MEQCKKTKILYFSKGVPTEEDKKKAQELGALIRDASAWKPGDFIEMCDMVAGKVPSCTGTSNELTSQILMAFPGRSLRRKPRQKIASPDVLPNFQY